MFQYIICCWFNESVSAPANVAIVVSIHYMLLVQLLIFHRLLPLILCFNTLYVVGSICKSHRFTKNYCCFNTLYVVGSKTATIIGTQRSSVSIHYMLLVQSIFNRFTYSLYIVSIHYMLLVQCFFKSSFFKSTRVSIHYMLLVQFLIVVKISLISVFQYIICCWFKYARKLLLL